MLVNSEILLLTTENFTLISFEAEVEPFASALPPVTSLENIRFWPVIFKTDVEVMLNCRVRFVAVELTRLRP